MFEFIKIGQIIISGCGKWHFYLIDSIPDDGAGHDDVAPVR
jgi:hypothetical protein